MVENKLTFTLVGSDESRSGALVSDLIIVLRGLEDAVRLMVQHLGEREKGPGQPPRWIRDQSTLRVLETRPGSLMADLVVEAPPDGQIYLENLGNQAVRAFQKWDGTEGSTLPEVVVDTLSEAVAKLPEGRRFWLGDVDNPHKVEVRRKLVDTRATTGTTAALVHGWLKEVNWDKRTAQLHDYSGGYVNLRFNAELDYEMLRLATQYIEVRGKGRFGAKGGWTTIEVTQVSPSRSWNDPFDVGAFLNDPNTRVFDAERLVRASEPFDVDDFIRDVHEGREVG